MKLPCSMSAQPSLRSTGVNGRALMLLVGCAFLAITSASQAAVKTISTAANIVSGNHISGMWWIEDYTVQLAPPDNATLPFTPAGKRAYDQNVEQLKSGAMADVGTTKCLPEGLPRTLFAAYPLQLVQHGDYVTLIQELNHTFWSVALAAPHPGPDELDPAFMGDSIGHWENNTLVIDSVGFKANSFLDDSGLPHGDKLHVVTRIHRFGHHRLEVVATIDDPDFFTRPFSVKHTYEWRPDVRLLEYVCGEDHRALIGVRVNGVRLKWLAK